jgi:predicted peroxiredoxin
LATILYISTFGTDDPTRATLPFVGASGALDAGHQPQIMLLGEATILIKESFAERVQGFGIPALRDLLQKLAANDVPIYV